VKLAVRAPTSSVRLEFGFRSFFTTLTIHIEDANSASPGILDLDLSDFFFPIFAGGAPISRVA